MVDKERLPSSCMDHKECISCWEVTSSAYLYKGIEVSSFVRYFKEGGISPFFPNRAWITDYWVVANAWADILNPEQNYCLAVVDKSAAKRNNLEEVLDISSCHIRGLLFHNYYGSGKIYWPEIVKLFVTAPTIEEIARTYHQVEPLDLEWGQFSQRVVLLDNPDAFPEVRFKELPLSQLQSALIE